MFYFTHVIGTYMVYIYYVYTNYNVPTIHARHHKVVIIKKVITISTMAVLPKRALSTVIVYLYV